jgi:hypothetical protein
MKITTAFFLPLSRPCTRRNREIVASRRSSSPWFDRPSVGHATGEILPACFALLLKEVSASILRCRELTMGCCGLRWRYVYSS